MVVTEKESDKIDLSDWSDVTVIEITAGKQVPEDQMTSVVSEVLREVSLSGHCPV
ncbi:MAG: hypothetical protein Q8O49_00810 [bacterium]|nr:hypothetical protein [bacterium]